MEPLPPPLHLAFSVSKGTLLLGPIFRFALGQMILYNLRAFSGGVGDGLDLLANRVVFRFDSTRLAQWNSDHD